MFKWLGPGVFLGIYLLELLDSYVPMVLLFHCIMNVFLIVVLLA